LQSQGLIKKVMSYEMEQWQQQQICSDGRFCLCFYAHRSQLKFIIPTDVVTINNTQVAKRVRERWTIRLIEKVQSQCEMKWSNGRWMEE
jgi:hypothetical protein